MEKLILIWLRLSSLKTSKMSTDKPLLVFLYHSRCYDGTTAAAIAQSYFIEHEFPSTHVYIGIYPGDLEKTVDQIIEKYKDRKAAVMSMDIAFTKTALKKLKDNFSKVQILDHHWGTSQEINPDHENLIFDMNKCGATLTYHFLWEANEEPLFLKYIEDQDIYQFRQKDSKLINEGIHYLLKFKYWTLEEANKYLNQFDISVEAFNNEKSVPDFRKWQKYLNSTKWLKTLQMGRIIHKYKSRLIRKTAYLSRTRTIGKHKVRVCESNAFANELADLYEDQDFDYILIYSRDLSKKDYVRVSLRSRKNGVNVALIAQKFGGSGHIHAAGFSCTVQELLSMIDS